MLVCSSCWSAPTSKNPGSCDGVLYDQPFDLHGKTVRLVPERDARSVHRGAPHCGTKCGTKAPRQASGLLSLRRAQLPQNFRDTPDLPGILHVRHTRVPGVVHAHVSMQSSPPRIDSYCTALLGVRKMEVTAILPAQ